MLRSPLRVRCAAWLLVAFMVTSVGPVATAALAESSGQDDEHACCPEKVGEDAQPTRSSDVPLPCCAIGNANSQAPAGAPTVTRVSAPHVVPVPTPAWSQSLAPRIHPRPHTTVTLGPVPRLIRTSVLLI
jgi:hypothetical protein